MAEADAEAAEEAETAVPRLSFYKVCPRARRAISRRRALLEEFSLALREIFSPCTHLVLTSAIAANCIDSSHPLEAVTLPMEDLSVAATHLYSRGTAVSASSAASASASATRSTSSYSSLCRPTSCFASSLTPQSSLQQDSVAPRIQRQILSSPTAFRIHKPEWSSRYPEASASA